MIMKKILTIFTIFLLFSCNIYKDIYSGKKTKYSSVTNENLKKLGEDIEKMLNTKYGQVDIVNLKKYVDNKKAYVKHIIDDENKLEYDNILIEGLERVHREKLNKLKENGLLNYKTKKRLKKLFNEIKKDIKELETIEDYELYFSYKDKIKELTK